MLELATSILGSWNPCPRGRHACAGYLEHLFGK